MSAQQTRRQLIGRSLTLAAGACAAGAAIGPTVASAAPASKRPVSDFEAIRNALEVEQLIVFAYEHVLALSLVPAPQAETMRALLADEREHIAALSPALAALGGEAPPAPTSAAAVDRLLIAREMSDRLNDLHTQDDCLKLLIDLESLVEGAYYVVAQYVRDSGLVRLGGEIMACEAQHWAVLGFMHHSAKVQSDTAKVQRAVPYAFVFGYGDSLPQAHGSGS